MTHIMNMLRTALCFTLIAQLAGCGTLIYPERRGQRHGRIDVGVAVLDGIGLLFFIIPGLIAFAIDFSTGAIYLPGGVISSFDPKHSTAATIEAILQKETGHRITLTQENMEITRLASLEEMSKRFAEAMPSDQPMRVAVNTP